MARSIRIKGSTQARDRECPRDSGLALPAANATPGEKIRRRATQD
jgi:hypothetical protein